MYRRLSARLSHSLPSSPPKLVHASSDSGGRLVSVRAELEGIRIASPRHPPVNPSSVEGGREGDRPTDGGGRGGGEVVEISHPWPEWVQLMELLLTKNYLDRAALKTDIFSNSSSSSSSLSISKDSNHIRTACLNFAKDRFDIIRYLSRRDMQIIVQCGCPSIDRKVVNSGKRLRAHVGIHEGDVCSSCSLRGSCERAYVKAQRDEVGRTADVMRILLTHGLDIITGSVENPACVNMTVKESIRKLLSQMFEFGSMELDPNNQSLTSLRPLSKQNNSGRHQLFKGQITVPMKQGDWICPKCNFLNFAKNIKCLRCNGEFQERIKKLHEDQDHLPLKKGDWICEKCNFLNFAKNTKCLQCNEKPPKRHLNPGEWECPSCNYINFRKNMVCLRCEWKRPKSMANGEFVRTLHDSAGPTKSRPISFVLDCDSNNVKSFKHGDNLGIWSSDDDDDDNLDHWNSFAGFDNFPIAGGRSEVSQDPPAREKWKAEMLKRSRVKESKRGLPSAYLGSRIEVDGSSTDDDIAGWFGNGKN